MPHMAARRVAAAGSGERWGSPVRILAVGQALTSAGDGAWLTVWTIYLTTYGALSLSEFALGVTLGGALGLLTVLGPNLCWSASLR